MDENDLERLEGANRQIEVLTANLAELDIAMARTTGYVWRLIGELNALNLPEVDEGEDGKEK